MIRHQKDKQFDLPAGSVRLEGFAHEKIRTVCEGTLKAIDMEALADYFRNTADMFATGEFWGKIMRAACLICAPSSLGMRSVIAALLQIVPATRTISGEVYRIDYPTDTQDAPIVTIVTEDGHEWITDDYISPRHTPLEITFSTNSTEDVTDDEIISIASIWTR